MTQIKKVDPKIREMIVGLAQKHAWNIGVSNYEIDIHYMKEDRKGDDRDSDIMAEMDTDRRYLKGTMKIYPALLKKYETHKDEVILNDAVAHEIAHLATQHFYDVAVARYCDDGEMKDAWEMCTEVIARMSRRIRALEEKKKK